MKMREKSMRIMNLPKITKCLIKSIMQLKGLKKGMKITVLSKDVRSLKIIAENFSG